MHRFKVTMTKPAGQVTVIPAEDNRLLILKLIHYNLVTMYFYIFIKKLVLNGNQLIKKLQQN